jgi:hypothetical protein
LHCVLEVHPNSICFRARLIPTSHSDSDYKDRLELKSTTDRTLGVGVIQSEGTLLILTAATMMKATIDVDNVLAFDPQYDRPFNQPVPPLTYHTHAETDKQNSSKQP